jgi:hypothetical protein
MKKLSRKWKRIIGWTLFIHLLILLALFRFQFTLGLQQQTVEETLSKVVEEAPDASAQTLGADELPLLLGGVAEEWSQAEPEEQEAMLASRLSELEEMNPERVDAIVEHLIRLGASPAPEKENVLLRELDLDTAVLVSMHKQKHEDGRPGVQMELQDALGKTASFWVPESEMTEEDFRALRAFELMNEVPALQKLRPFLPSLLRR